jgi:hypothetical protein
MSVIVTVWLKGVSRKPAQRLVAGQEIVIDVPAKLSARMRVYASCKAFLRH